MLMQLAGQTALVTGASRGIGQAIALSLAEAGADVAVAARSAGALEGVAAEIRQKGRRALALPTDVTDDAQVQAMVARVAHEWGRLDILVNNAGAIILKDFVETPIAEFRRMMELNFMSTVVACKAAVPIMQAQRHGHIINISSISGTVGYSAHSAYSAAKGALIRLTEAMAEELKEYNIAVNAICPNAVDTNLFDDWAREHNLTLDRSGWIQPREIGELVVFLCSPAARSITGESIVIRGMYKSG
jgi:meso-butanediol dehydrogenase/(S,S)-butanediol dehydrogenase/diacetyl reductase